ncbi:MAG TPA: CHAT domain-containing protein [Coleofasciculaceae cyanobacterium]
MPVKTTSVFSAVPPTAVEDLLQQGKKFYNRTQYRDAVEVLQQAVSTLEIQGDKVGMAIALSNLSLAYQQLGQWQKAEQAIAASLNLLPTASPDLDSESAQILAQILDVRGRLQLKQGQTQAALNTWQQTTDLYRQLEDEAGIIRSQINQAQGMNGLGMYFQAEKILTETVRLLENQPNSTLKATALRYLGSVYRRIGDLDRSRQVLKQSLALAKADSTPTGDILLSLGNTALVRSQPKAASNFYREALVHAASPSTRIQAQLNQLSLLGQENPQAVLHLARQIESQLKSLPSSHTAIYAQISLVENLQRLRRDNIDVFSESKLLQILTEARQQAQELGDAPAISYALGNLAHVYAQNGQSQRAIDLTQQALYQGQAVNDLNLTYRWQWQLGRLQKEARKTTEAIAAYTEAVNNLQELRNNIVALDPKVQFYFRERVEPVYRELVDLLLQPQSTQADLVLARQTIESLQLVELENYFRQACLEPKVEIDDIVNRDNSTAVIYPIVLADRLEIIVKFPQSKLLHFTTPIKRDELETTTATLRKDLLDVTKTAAVKQRSQQLYSWLIKPLETALIQNQIDTLVFVLDGSLRNIPVSVLYDPKQQQYLIEKYAIVVAPGLQLVKSRSLSPTELNVLTAGISQERIVAGRDFSSLANVKQELQQIQSKVAKSKQLINREFTQANLQTQLDLTNFTTVHLATHGKFSSNPEQTFILTWDRLLKTQDLASLMRQYNLNEDDAIELLVLSACETATGDPLAALGLAGIAVRAGVRSTLASLWFADDRYSSEIMSSFYQELSQGTTKAKALQRAQIAVLKKEKRPYFWSSFILLGNWL